MTFNPKHSPYAFRQFQGILRRFDGGPLAAMSEVELLGGEFFASTFAGEASVSFGATAIIGSVLTSVGEATVAFGGGATIRGALSSTGEALVSFGGAAIVGSVLTSTGEATFGAVGEEGGENSFTCSGEALVSFSGAAVIASVLTSDGEAFCTFAGAGPVYSSPEPERRATVEREDRTAYVEFELRKAAA